MNAPDVFGVEKWQGDRKARKEEGQDVHRVV
jgi:hypothetical protein